MSNIFHVAGTPGTGFGTLSAGTTASHQNTVALPSYYYDDVKLPGVCEQSTTWTASTAISGLYYSKIGSRIFLRGSVSKAWGGSGITTIGTIETAARPTQQEQWIIKPTNSVNVLLQLSTAGVLSIVWARNCAASVSNNTSSQTLAINYEYWGA